MNTEYYNCIFGLPQASQWGLMMCAEEMKKDFAEMRKIIDKEQSFFEAI